MRGKYRQFILRVTADNNDEILSANVAITPEKTLELIIEMVNNMMLYLAVQHLRSS